MFSKFIWRRFLKIYADSIVHYWVSNLLHIFEFEGFIITYSQFGEDMILEDHFRGKKQGFYIDVGCNRPIQGSNTFRLYMKGWRGINIDGNERLIKKFKKIRKRDVNLCEIVSDKEGPMKFYVSADDRVSTVSGEFKEWIKDHRNYSDEIQTTSKSLQKLLEKYLPKEQKIDFLNIDVEGHDYEVLCSNDFEKFRPTVICIEDHDFSLDKISNSKIYTHLTSKNYSLIGFANPNLFFEDALASK